MSSVKIIKFLNKSVYVKLVYKKLEKSIISDTIKSK